MRILILGASGMLGHTMYRVLADDAELEVFGTIRSESARRALPATKNASLISGIEAESPDSLLRAFAESRPDAVINCVGLVKQLSSANDPLGAIPINAILPHRLARMAEATGARLVHVSTDCVFSGTAGKYKEADLPDANDLYGRSKLLGEVTSPHTITLRTSIIGPELGGGATGLVGWFLNQTGQVRGFRKAIFSGLPTVSLARLIKTKVLPRPDLQGLYHVSAEPIDKYTLLELVRQQYRKDIQITPSDDLVIDRSLDSDRFRSAAAYSPPSWQDLVAEMHAFG